MKYSKIIRLFLLLGVLSVIILIWYLRLPASGPEFQAKLEGIASAGTTEAVHTITKYLNDNTRLKWPPDCLCRKPMTRSEAAIYVLGNMDNPEAIDCLLALSKSTPELRLYIVFALKNRTDPKAVHALGEILLNKEENPDIRRLIAGFLGETDTKEGFLILLKALENEQDAGFMKSIILSSIGIITNHEPPLDSPTTVTSTIAFYRRWWIENKNSTPFDWKVKGFKNECEELSELGSDNFIPILITTARQSQRRAAPFAAMKILQVIAPEANASDLVEYENWYEENKAILIWDNHSRRYKVIRKM